MKVQLDKQAHVANEKPMRTDRHWAGPQFRLRVAKISKYRPRYGRGAAFCCFCFFHFLKILAT